VNRVEATLFRRTLVVGIHGSVKNILHNETKDKMAIV
jgi:hypothetical protein